MFSPMTTSSASAPSCSVSERHRHCCFGGGCGWLWVVVVVQVAAGAGAGRVIAAFRVHLWRARSPVAADRLLAVAHWKVSGCWRPAI